MTSGSSATARSLTKWTRLFRRPRSSVQRIVFLVIRCTATVRSWRFTSWRMPPIFLGSCGRSCASSSEPARHTRIPIPAHRIIGRSLPIGLSLGMDAGLGPRPHGRILERREGRLPAEVERALLAGVGPEALILRIAQVAAARPDAGHQTADDDLV